MSGCWTNGTQPTKEWQGCVLADKFQGRRFDCGSVEGGVEATNFRFHQC